MANGYVVRIDSISTDGTNMFVTISIFDGAHQLPPITAVFPVATSTAAQIKTYVNTIATNGSSLSSDFSALVGYTIAG